MYESRKILPFGITALQYIRAPATNNGKTIFLCLNVQSTNKYSQAVICFINY